jgi:DNA-binding protein
VASVTNYGLTILVSACLIRRKVRIHTEGQNFSSALNSRLIVKMKMMASTGAYRIYSGIQIMVRTNL